MFSSSLLAPVQAQIQASELIARGREIAIADAARIAVSAGLA